MTQQEVNGLLERPKPNIEAANIEVRDRLDAANRRIEQLEAANGRLVSALQKAVGHPITGDWYDEAIEAIAKANESANT